LLSYGRLSKKPLLFKSFTSLTVEQFDNIYKEIAKRYEKHEIKHLSSKRKQRKRSIGAGGRLFKLDLRNRFLMLLIYYCRLYITYTLTSFLFDLNQSNVCMGIQKIENLIRKCLPIPDKIYKRITKRLQTLEEIEEYYPDLVVFIDTTTEQQIPKPKNKKRRRKKYYSGKKKKHTVKNQYTVNNDDLIMHKTGHKRGKRHDYNIYKKNHPVIPKEVENVFDLGFIGAEKDFPEQRLSLPYRKKRKQEISIEQKEYNKSHSKRRIVIEHTICRLKKYKILADIFRNRLRKYNKVSDIVSGLINYRITSSL